MRDCRAQSYDSLVVRARPQRCRDRSIEWFRCAPLLGPRANGNESRPGGLAGPDQESVWHAFRKSALSRGGPTQAANGQRRIADPPDTMLVSNVDSLALTHEETR